MSRLKKQIEKFVSDVLDKYSILTYELSLNDHEDFRQDWEVIIRNKTNSKKIHSILRVREYDDSIYLLKGEDFVLCDTNDFIMDLFLTLFLTLPEN